MAKKQTSLVRKVAVMAMILAVAALGYTGWTWLDGLTVQRVVVDGTRHADEAAVRAVARVDSGGRLLDVDHALIADRVRRHPWVRSAGVRRLPPGTVWISVEERLPIVLQLGHDGTPQGYLDREGYPLPFAERAVYDVPLLRGVAVPENPTRPVQTETVRELLAALGRLDPDIDALISSLEVHASGDVTLHTAPAGTQASVDIRLGRRGYAETFRRLHAFWRQAVLPRPQKTFESIDLRFDGQIVTKES